MYKSMHNRFKNNATMASCYDLPAEILEVIFKYLDGSWIITGHSNGYILIWNLNTGEFESKHRVHLSSVTDMALVDLLYLDSYYGFKALPWSHHHIITGSKDSSIRILSLLEDIDYTDQNLFLNKHGDAIKSIRIFGGKFVASSGDNTISLWSLDVKKKPSFRLDAKLLHTITGPADYLLELGLWYDKIYCISHANQLYTYNMKNEWLKQPRFKSNWLEISRRRFIVTAIRAFRDQIIIMFTACAKMIVFIDEKNYKVYFLMLTLHASIVSIALHGTILALGLENGKLYLYYIQNNKALLELDLACPTFQSMLSEASIMSVDVVYNYDSPTVVASTTESLFVVKWNKSRFEVSH
ncbi:f-box domain-containing protein [Caerostris extrusa]|uniref:F-box domain-containing protein n=1 Tax=Caerostris extrusa TaxID=172846 RepID=A0AAV4MHD1_CAEEX|nr:f-box domain-containing protein [Caerostris extrusa]